MSEHHRRSAGHKSQIYGAIVFASMPLCLYLLGRLIVGSAIVNPSRWDQGIE